MNSFVFLMMGFQAGEGESDPLMSVENGSGLKLAVTQMSPCMEDEQRSSRVMAFSI